MLLTPVDSRMAASHRPSATSSTLYQLCAPSTSGVRLGEGVGRHSRSIHSISRSNTGRQLAHSSRQLALVASRSKFVVRASSGTCHPGEEREGSAGRDGHFPSNMAVPTTGMAGFGGQLSGGGATLQRGKLDLSREVKSWEPKLDEGGGGGGIGNKIFNGGGGDGGDDDDDDYFDDFGEGDGDGDGDGFFRTAIGQLYDEASRNAVLQEWFRTMSDLPVMLRQAASFGLLSSAQLVRFFSMDVRPNLTRFVTRSMPVQASRGIVGRLMADPAFMQKVAIEQMITLVGSLYWESRARGERFTKELDLVAINTLSLQAANLALVWMISPNRSFGVPHKYDWQRMLHELPANVFDASGPQRVYTMNSRMAGLLAKTAELCAVGSITGGAMSLMQMAAVKAHQLVNPEYQPSVVVPDFWRSSCGMAASMGLASNLRYQLIAGADRWLFDHGKYIAPYLASSTLMRVVSNRLGEETRLFLQGFPNKFEHASSSTSPLRQQQQLLAALQARAQVAAAGQKAAQPVKKAKKSKKARGFEMSLGTSAASAQ